MSGANFTGDACGAQNPLMRMASHVTRDHSYRQEGLGVNAATVGATAAPTTISMGALLQNIDGLHLNPSRPVSGATVANSSSSWSDEFAAAAVSGPVQRGSFSLSMPGPYLDTAHIFTHRPLAPGLPVSQDTWASDFLSQKDNVLDLAQLKEEEDPALREAARNFVSDIIDKELQDTTFMDYVRNLAGNEEIPEASYKDLQELDDALEASRSKTHSYDDDVTFWKNLEETYRTHFLADLDAGSLAGTPSAAGLEYRFAETNEHLKEETDAFAKGEAYLREGNIPEAVLCFEAAVQQKPDSAAAWERLGLVLAENEQESDAIIACRKCLEIDPDNGSALISLARSFTNEMLNRDACLTLQRWLASQEPYKQLVPPANLEKSQLGNVNQFTSSFPTTRSFVSQEEFEAIESLLLQAVRLGAGAVDADLQIAMGILYNISADFTKAVDCFEAALKVRSQDPLLWNKLGATLANSRRSELAIDAYRRALELAPGFVRARANLSIACIEMGAVWEAVEHGLVALNLQAKSSQKGGSGPGSDNSIWSLIRMAIMRFEDQLRVNTPSRQDLLTLVDKRDLGSLNVIFQIFSED